MAGAASVLLLNGIAAHGAPQAATQPAARKHILVLITTGYGRPGVDQYLHSFISTLEANGMSANDASVEFLDLVHPHDSEFQARKRALLLHQYGKKKIDLILVGQQPAMNYLLGELKDLAPDAPVIAADATVPARFAASGHHFLLQAVNTDIKGTLDRALDLFPQTNHILAVVGSGEQDRATKINIQKAAAALRGRLTFEYTDGTPLAEILKRAASAPPHTIVYFGTFYRDSTGEDIVAYEAGAKLAKIANAPVFSPFASGLGLGMTGGSVLGLDQDGELAGQAALDILSGKMRLNELLTELPSRSVPTFDWRQIQRWRGDAARLPPNSIFVNRPLTLWGQYKQVVINTGIVFAALVSLLVGLTIENRRRKRAETAALESEARFRVLVEQAPEAIFVFDTDSKKIVDVNGPAESLTGRAREELLMAGMETLYAMVQPDGRPVAETVPVHMAQALAGKEVVFERKLINSDGKETYCEVRVVRLPSANRNLLRGSFIDITERKQAEEAIHKNAEQQKLFIQDVLGSATEGKLIICFQPEDLPDGRPDGADKTPLDSTTGHHALRRLAYAAGVANGLSLNRVQDLETAVGEAAMNAIVHAGGGVGYMGTMAGGVQVWIDDHGRGIAVKDLPQAALKKGYTTAGTFGHGMKMMLQTVDRVYLLTGPEGTTVVLEQYRNPPVPDWLMLG